MDGCGAPQQSATPVAEDTAAEVVATAVVRVAQAARARAPRRTIRGDRLLPPVLPAATRTSPPSSGCDEIGSRHRSLRSTKAAADPAGDDESPHPQQISSAALAPSTSVITS